MYQCPLDVVEGRLMTKEKRQELFGQVAGGAGSCKPEHFQRHKLIEGTGKECPKTTIRINLRPRTLTDIKNRIYVGDRDTLIGSMGYKM